MVVVSLAMVSASGSPIPMLTGAVRKKRRLEDSKPSAEDLKFLESHTTFAPCRATGLRGLLNMGSTCFMSVILQSLIHNPLVRNFYLSDGHKQKECVQTNCMSCAMDEVFSEFFTSDKMDGYGPVNLLTTSWKCEQVKNLRCCLYIALVETCRFTRLDGFYRHLQATNSRMRTSIYSFC
jgi:hypothetical protein